MRTYKKEHTNKEALENHIIKIKKRGGKYSVKGNVITYSFPEKVLKSKKKWINDKAIAITPNFTNPFTGDITDDRPHVKFRMINVPLEVAERFNSWEELLAYASK